MTAVTWDESGYPIGRITWTAQTARQASNIPDTTAYNEYRFVVTNDVNGSQCHGLASIAKLAL